MNQQLLQQALNEAKADAIEVFTYEDGIAQSARDAIEYMHSWLGVYFEKQALAQQEQPASDLTRDLAMMIRRLVLSVRRIAEDDSKDLSFANSCLSWLRGKGLAGAPLREGELTGKEQPAQEPDEWKSQPRLTVRLTSYPESNGKRNWTAMFARTEPFDGLVGSSGGITIARGEYWNRVAFEAERAKFLIGERDTEPFILDYGKDIQTPQEWAGEMGVDRYKRNKPTEAA